MVILIHNSIWSKTFWNVSHSRTSLLIAAFVWVQVKHVSIVRGDVGFHSKYVRAESAEVYKVTSALDVPRDATQSHHVESAHCHLMRVKILLDPTPLVKTMEAPLSESTPIHVGVFFMYFILLTLNENSDESVPVRFRHLVFVLYSGYYVNTKANPLRILDWTLRDYYTSCLISIVCA